jgi:hypothetical protein
LYLLNKNKQTRIIFNKTLVKDILDLHLNPYFPWYYNSKTIESDKINNYQFVHTFFIDNKITSDYFPLVKKLIDSKIKYKRIVRIKSNFTTKKNKKVLSFHQDEIEDNYLSLLYYINSTDGDTIFKIKNKIIKTKPIKGTGFLFKSNLYHSATNPKKYDSRIVLNYVVEI